VVLAFVYYWAVEPILVRFIVPTTSIHDGIEYYNDAKYLDFESGSRFHDLLDDSDLVSNGVVVDFYHVDNHLRDNPIYGKMCDVFAVDVELNSAIYSNYQKTIITNCRYVCEMDDYDLYVRSEDTEAREVVLLALSEYACVIRIILITDKEKEISELNYSTTLIMQSSLNWVNDPKTGIKTD
jgi:hypothetical protein